MMDNFRFDFNNFGEAFTKASDVGMERLRNIPIDRMYEAEREELTIERAWIMELRCQYVPKCTDPAVPGVITLEAASMTRLYADINTFQADYHNLSLMKDVELIGFSLYKLQNDSYPMIFLDCLTSKFPLSAQLSLLTGCSYNSLDFHNENQPDSLTSQGIIVHRKTQQKFYVPPMSIEVLAEAVCDTSL
jgi:hypothetical protein